MAQSLLRTGRYIEPLKAFLRSGLPGKQIWKRVGGNRGRVSGEGGHACELEGGREGGEWREVGRERVREGRSEGVRKEGRECGRE